MHIGCHAVLFKDAISTDTVNVLQSLHDAGAEGAEIGARFFGIGRVSELNQALKKTNMKMSGMHVSPLLVGYLDNFEECRKTVLSVAEFVSHTECSNIIMTGGVDWKAPDYGDARLQNKEFMVEVAKKINELAIEIKEKYGIQINYHNHNWEFLNDGLIFNALVENAPDLHFALDVGWASVAGFDPIELIQNLAGRINYIHLRDYRKKDMNGLVSFVDFQNCFVSLGEGDIDFRTLLDVFRKTAGNDSWAVVEYEVGDVDAVRYKRAVDYVKSLL